MISCIPYTPPNNSAPARMNHSIIFDSICEEIGHLFHEFELVEVFTSPPKSLTIASFPLMKEVRDEIIRFYGEKNFLVRSEANIDTIGYKITKEHVPINIVYLFNHADYDAYKSKFEPISNIVYPTTTLPISDINDEKDGFWKKTVINKVLITFARSLGYILETNTFDPNQTFLFVKATTGHYEYRKMLTSDLSVCLKILGFTDLEIPAVDSTCSDSENAKRVVDWITSSERFNSQRFVNMCNPCTYTNQLEKAILTLIRKSSVNHPFTKGSLEYEKKYLDSQRIKEIERFFREQRFNIKNSSSRFSRSKKTEKKGIKNYPGLINVKFLLHLGYEPGPYLEEILKDVSENFTPDSSIQQIKNYVLARYRKRKDV